MRRSSMAHTARPEYVAPISALLGEKVNLPGFPQIIVTRGWLYTFLSSRGWSKSESGFGSLDYAAFGRPKVDSKRFIELTPDDYRDSIIAEVEKKEPIWTRSTAVQQ